MKLKNIMLISMIISFMMSGVAFAATPTPINLESSTGAGYLDYSWDAGAGNVTDTYNISKTIDSTTAWTNGTTITDIRYTDAGETVTIYVYAFNTTYSELSTGVTASVAVPMMFNTIVVLISAIVPLFSSILDLIIAVFPLIIAFVFLAGLAIMVNKIFGNVFDFKIGKR